MDLAEATDAINRCGVILKTIEETPTHCDSLVQKLDEISRLMSGVSQSLTELQSQLIESKKD